MPDYVGTYEVSPELTYAVIAEGGHLIGQRGHRAPSELLPESPDVFFIKGSPSRRIFIRDEKGKVISMIDRLNGRDLVWKKTK